MKTKNRTTRATSGKEKSKGVLDKLAQGGALRGFGLGGFLKKKNVMVSLLQQSIVSSSYGVVSSCLRSMI